MVSRRRIDAGVCGVVADDAARTAASILTWKRLAAVVEDAVAIHRPTERAAHHAAPLDALERLVHGRSRTCGSTRPAMVSARPQIHVAGKARLRACSVALGAFVRRTIGERFDDVRVGRRSEQATPSVDRPVSERLWLLVDAGVEDGTRRGDDHRCRSAPQPSAPRRRENAHGFVSLSPIDERTRRAYGEPGRAARKRSPLLRASSRRPENASA
ncbi:MAG: hypothetical protein K0S65_963 [Labilithrix sp.]|nr:hypothetical protein [Labilithrix sp.]